MKTYGVEISLKTLRRWRSDNNISKGVVITNYKEEERTLYTCNCTFSNNTNSMEQNKTDMEENKHDVRARNNYVEQLPIDEETKEQGANNWGFRLVKYPVFAMVFDV